MKKALGVGIPGKGIIWRIEDGQRVGVFAGKEGGWISGIVMTIDDTAERLVKVVTIEREDGAGVIVLGGVRAGDDRIRPAVVAEELN